MAPSTRLRSQPERRVNYAPPRRAGTRGNPIPLEESPAPQSIDHRESEVPEPTMRVRQTTRNPAARVKDGAVVKPKAEPKKAVSAAPKPKKKKRPVQQECSICAATKNTIRCFKVPEDANVCKHFESICNACIHKMLRSKVAERQLTEVELACPFPNCDHVLDFTVLKNTVSKAEFDAFDKALTRYALTAGESYVACLSEKCGKYFSVEDCKNIKNKKKKIECPYCAYEMCLTCNRPWASHTSGDCSKAKAKEDKESLEAVKAIGAKPCPKCGVNIEKFGGCDHMTCRRCRHNFCWQCLVPYSSNVQHADGCPHGQVNVAADPGNWAPEDLNIAQVNNLIHQAQARLNNPPAPPPGRVGAPARAPVPAVVPALNVQVARARVPFQFPGGLFNLFGMGGGAGGGGPPNPPQ